MFPTDTKNVTIDDHTAISGILLPQVAYNRTAIAGTIYCSGAKDNHIVLGSTLTQPNNNNLMDSESVPRYQTFIYRLIPANTDIYYQKGLAQTSCFFTLLYTDYDLSLTSTTTQPVIFSNGIAVKTGYSYGEVFIILLLLMIFTQLFFSAVKEYIFGVKVENPLKNKYNRDI